MNDFKTVNNKLSEEGIIITHSFYKVSDQTLPFYLTIRSPVVNVETRGRFDNNDYFNSPMNILFAYNELRLNGEDIKEEDLRVKLNLN